MIKYGTEALTGELDQRAAKVAADYQDGQELKVNLKSKELVSKEDQIKLVQAHGHTEGATGEIISQGIEVSKNELVTSKKAEITSKLKATQISAQSVTKKVTFKQSITPAFLSNIALNPRGMTMLLGRRPCFPRTGGLFGSITFCRSMTTRAEKAFNRDVQILKKLEEGFYPSDVINAHYMLPYPIRNHIMNMLAGDEFDVEKIFETNKNIRRLFLRHTYQAWIIGTYLRFKIYNSTTREAILVMEWIGTLKHRVKFKFFRFEDLIEYVQAFEQLEEKERTDFLNIWKAKLNHVQKSRSPLSACYTKIPPRLLEDPDSNCYLIKRARETYESKAAYGIWGRVTERFERDRPAIFACVTLKEICQEYPTFIADTGEDILSNPVFMELETEFENLSKWVQNSDEATEAYKQVIASIESIPAEWRERADDGQVLFSDDLSKYPDLLDPDAGLPEDEDDWHTLEEEIDELDPDLEPGVDPELEERARKRAKKLKLELEEEDDQDMNPKPEKDWKAEWEQSVRETREALGVVEEEEESYCERAIREHYEQEDERRWKAYLDSHLYSEPDSEDPDSDSDTDKK
jgi:hypothetical protein